MASVDGTARRRSFPWARFLILHSWDYRLSPHSKCVLRIASEKLRISPDRTLEPLQPGLFDDLIED